MITVLRNSQPVARQDYVCEFCGCKIKKGDKYNKQTNVFDGEIYDFKTHVECSEVSIKLDMYNDLSDEGLSMDTFKENISNYIYANHYDDEADDISEEWCNLTAHEEIVKINNELK